MSNIYSSVCGGRLRWYSRGFNRRLFVGILAVSTADSYSISESFVVNTTA